MATLRAENSALNERVAMLQSEIVALQENLAQSEILYTLLDFARSNPEHEYLAATVIGREISPPICNISSLIRVRTMACVMACRW